MLLHVLAAALATTSDHWALLVAGSKGYSNYRHTADVCHAYHTLRAKGIPASNIVTMIYGDVARSPENPFPNQIFNAPTEKGVPGKDVYAGCAIDWWGQTVTPANFVRVLMGDTMSEPVEEAPAGNKTYMARPTLCLTWPPRAPLVLLQPPLTRTGATSKRRASPAPARPWPAALRRTPAAAARHPAPSTTSATHGAAARRGTSATVRPAASPAALRPRRRSACSDRRARRSCLSTS